MGSHASGLFFQTPTDAYSPVISSLAEERKRFRSPGPALTYLHDVSLSLPSEALSQGTALNLTEVTWFPCPGDRARQTRPTDLLPLTFAELKKIRNFFTEVQILGLSGTTGGAWAQPPRQLGGVPAEDARVLCWFPRARPACPAPWAFGCRSWRPPRGPWHWVRGCQASGRRSAGPSAAVRTVWPSAAVCISAGIPSCPQPCAQAPCTHCHRAPALRCPRSAARSRRGRPWAPVDLLPSLSAVGLSADVGSEGPSVRTGSGAGCPGSDGRCRPQAFASCPRPPH